MGPYVQAIGAGERGLSGAKESFVISTVDGAVQTIDVRPACRSGGNLRFLFFVPSPLPDNDRPKAVAETLAGASPLLFLTC